MNKKVKQNTKYLYYLLALIISAVLILGLLERHATVRHFNMFSIQNIFEVSLFFIIGVPVLILLKKMFSKKNQKL